MKNHIATALKGMAMGMAEVVPGVSGGTIAFITGIYERLLNVIKSIGPDAWMAFKEGGVQGLWKKLDGTFLVALLAGMVLGIVVGVFLITHLLETYPLLVWSYFFGLIVVSAWFVGRQIDDWNWKPVVAMLSGAALAYYITIAVPAPGNPALYFVFISGAIAVSALMLPGLSGSFILLLMGMYSFVIPTIKEALKTLDPEKLLIVAVFGSGMLLGMIVFSRVVSWTFQKFRNTTLAVLTGFLIGSLNKIWPWQEVLSTMTKPSGETVVTFSKSVLPGTFETLQGNFLYGNDPQILFCIVCMILGFATVFGAEVMASRLTKS